MVKPHFITRLDSPTGEIPLSVLAKAVTHLSIILRELDKEISDGKISLIWALSGVHMGSPAEFEIAPLTLEEEFDALNSITKTIDGFGSLEQESKRPRFFSDIALRNARAFANLLDQKNITGISLRNDKQHVTLSHQLVANVDLIIPRKTEEFMGAIDGRLEMIDVHSGLKVGIYRIIDKKYIKVLFKDTKAMKQKAIDALDKRVYATGEIKRDHRGEPKEILVYDLKVLPEDSELPTLEDVYGIDPNFTGDLSVEEYLRKLRDE